MQLAKTQQCTSRPTVLATIGLDLDTTKDRRSLSGGARLRSVLILF